MIKQYSQENEDRQKNKQNDPLNFDYSSQSLSRTYISDLKQVGGEVYKMQGRLIGIINGNLIIQDVSGEVEVRGDKSCEVGDIVELYIAYDSENSHWKLKNLVVIQASFGFFINGLSKNYQKYIADRSLRKALLIRMEVFALIRKFFSQKQYFEVDTPVMLKYPGMEPYLEVFETRLVSEWDKQRRVNERMFLITSPEYAMKKLLVAGMEKIFQITRSFRNGEVFSELHNPEFAILEWYEAFQDYHFLMDETENLIKFVLSEISKKRQLSPQAKEVLDLLKFDKLSVSEAFEQYANVKEEVLLNEDKLRQVVMEKGYQGAEGFNYDDLFYLLMMREVEPGLKSRKAVFLYDYPWSQAALARKSEKHQGFAERFELYINGVEMCNGFSELNDAEEQGKRLLLEKKEREAAGKTLYDIDQDFIDALRMGMPPAAGNALGVDRLVMLAAGVDNIKDILFFPYADL